MNSENYWEMKSTLHLQFLGPRVPNFHRFVSTIAVFKFLHILGHVIVTQSTVVKHIAKTYEPHIFIWSNRLFVHTLRCAKSIVGGTPDTFMSVDMVGVTIPAFNRDAISYLSCLSLPFSSMCATCTFKHSQYALYMYLKPNHANWADPHPEVTVFFLLPMFQVNLAIPIIFLLLQLFLIVVPMYTSPIDVGVSGLICLSAVPAFWFINWRNKPRNLTRMFGKPCK